jgi:hypothetical protein
MQISTKLNHDQVLARAKAWGLSDEQCEKFTFQILPSSTTVVVYPGHQDSAAMNAFLAQLVSEGLAREIRS